MIELIKKHAVLTRPDGRYKISCKKGLWSIDGNIRHRVEKEALHYLQQYLADGEYGESLSVKD